jgi:hypothetical protein
MSISHFLEVANAPWKNVTFNDVTVDGVLTASGTVKAIDKILGGTLIEEVLASSTASAITGTMLFNGLVLFGSSSAINVSLPTASSLYSAVNSPLLDVNSTIHCLLVNKGTAAGAVTLTNADSNNNIGNLITVLPINISKVIYATLTQISPPKFSYYG